MHSRLFHIAGDWQDSHTLEASIGAAASSEGIFATIRPIGDAAGCPQTVAVAGSADHSSQERDGRRYAKQATVTLDERNPTEALAVGPHQSFKLAVANGLA